MYDYYKLKRSARYVLQYLLVPVLLEIIIESFSRKSLVSGVGYMFSSPVLFSFNTLIIMLTLSVALFFKREIFIFISIAIVWLCFGIANFVILHFRVTPFSAVDFTMIKTAISVSGHYLTVLNISMMLVAVCVLTFAMVSLYKRAPRHHKRNHKRMVFSASAVAVISLALVFLRSSSGSVKALATNYTNISEAYENYGFVYCFTNSIIDVGISKPDDYSEQSVNDIINKIDDSSKNQSKSKNSDDKPNIIMIQLESFFDVDYMKGLKFSEDPLPVFHELTKNYSSGLLTVPTVGAGTVNTDFEVLTGMRQRDFGACEYPYKTVLRNMTSESICNDLSKIGYTSHCVHNNSATFYGRNDVLKNLGFDTFTSMEYMNGLQENPNGWVNDDVIAPQIIKTLDSTDGADFTFGITVQSHGKYDVDTGDYEQKIKVLGAPEGMENQYNYYVNEIALVDKMLGNLIKRLENRNEKTVLVLYGDHLPSLDIKADELKNSDLYQTQYVIWDNFGLKKSDKDMAAYQLYSYVLNKIGIHEGLITKYHQQTDWDSDYYLSGLKTLEYDWFYGDKYAYGGMNEFEKTDLQMGTYPVVLENVKRNSKGYIVKGKGFTDYTYIYFGGRKLEGYKIDSSHYQITDNIEYDEDEGYMSLQMAKENNVADEDIPNAFMAKVIDADNVELSSSKPLLWNFTSLYLE